MIKVSHLRDYVIKPTLDRLSSIGINLTGLAAENLLLGTIAQESRLGTYLKQENGPALGIYQIEPATHEDIWKNFISFHPDLLSRVISIQHLPDPQDLITNLAYATAIARIIYYRVPEPLPDANDVEGLARYWKEHYNTPYGAGSVNMFMQNYEALVLNG